MLLKWKLAQGVRFYLSLSLSLYLHGHFVREGKGFEEALARRHALEAQLA
jgi:hypothetical protein